MPMRPFIWAPHVDHPYCAVRTETMKRPRINLCNLLERRFVGGGFIVRGVDALKNLRAEVTTDTVDADLCKVGDKQLHCFRAFGIGDQIDGAAFRDQSAAPIQKRFVVW